MISNAYLLSVLFVVAAMITCMTVKRLRILVFLVSASVVQNWEILLLKFLDLFKMLPILKINSSNGRVMGRLEGAADFLSQNDMSLSIWISYISLLEFGSGSFQHGYAHYNTSFLGVFLLTLMNFVIGSRIIFQNNVKQSVVLVFLYFCITALLGPNFALICLFAMLHYLFVSDNCANSQTF